MKRLKIDDAFIAKLTSGQEGFRAGANDEAVVLDVRGGEVVAVVPKDTDEEGVVGAAALIQGTLRLENERVLTFEVRKGARGARCADEPARLHREREGAATAQRLGRLRTAEEIMTRDVLTVSPDELVEDVAKQLAFHNISGMPVADWDGKVVGIVSEADVIGKLGSTVGDVMTHQVISVSRATPIEQIAVMMADRRIKRVPVLEAGTLVGIVSRADIVRALASSV